MLSVRRSFGDGGPGEAAIPQAWGPPSWHTFARPGSQASQAQSPTEACSTETGRGEDAGQMLWGRRRKGTLELHPEVPTGKPPMGGVQAACGS